MIGKTAYRWMIVAGLAGSLAVPAMADEAKGVWLRQEGAARVKIAACGGSLCGTIVWLKDMSGPGHVGQRVFFDMTSSGPNSWAGMAFNPEDGKTYSGKLAVNGNALTTTGCALGGLICRSMSWSRVDLRPYQTRTRDPCVQKKGHPEGRPKSREETPKKGIQRVRCGIYLCCGAQ